jgi:hypothetical protein
MPADRRLLDSSSLVTPPEPRVEAMTSTVDGYFSFDDATEEHVKRAKAAAEHEGWRHHGFR